MPSDELNGGGGRAGLTQLRGQNGDEKIKFLINVLELDIYHLTTVENGL